MKERQEWNREGYAACVALWELWKAREAYRAGDTRRPRAKGFGSDFVRRAARALDRKPTAVAYGIAAVYGLEKSKRDPDYIGVHSAALADVYDAFHDQMND